MLGLRLKHLQAVGEGDLVHDKDGAPVDADFFCGYRPLCKSFLTNIDV